MVEQGYDALKVVLIPYGGHLSSPADRRHVDRMMSVLCSTVGPDVDIMIGSRAGALCTPWASPRARR